MPPRPLPVALALALAPLLARSLAARPLPFSHLQAGPSRTVEMPPALPQATTTLRGRILDPAGAAIAGARLVAVGEGGSPVISTTSARDGAFTVPLPAGRYTLTIAAEGFAPASHELAAAPSAADAARDFVLAVAAIRETVTVTAPAAGYQPGTVASATKTPAPARDIPQSITVVTRALIQDQLMTSLADVVRYVPGLTAHQGENNRDQLIIRGNSSSADFFVNGVRDDVPYYRDLYNLDRIEALKGPNAVMFGRGGGGGVVNRVTKEAGFTPIRELTLAAGSFDHKRITTDLDHPFGSAVALRLNAVYENSGSFRRAVDLERYGVNPTLTIAPGARTQIAVGFEHFRDARTADRGVPSFQGRPADTDRRTYFGNPADSRVNAAVDVVSASLEHQAGSLTIRERTLVGEYERAYQNYVPGAVSADKAGVLLSAYNNDNRRTNVFNQVDATWRFATGSVQHGLAAGAEIGRQLSDNFRNTGYFENRTTSVLAPYADPVVATPVVFRQSATDADNRVTTQVAAAYLQEQVALTPSVRAMAGLRFDRFDLQYHNNRNGDDLERVDQLVSPRAGLVIKPSEPISLYGSYTVSHLPSAGDQFSSLTTVTQQLRPEKFSNYELGAKWDARPQLSVTIAAYRLDRTNTRATRLASSTTMTLIGSANWISMC